MSNLDSIVLDSSIIIIHFVLVRIFLKELFERAIILKKEKSITIWHWESIQNG